MVMDYALAVPSRWWRCRLRVAAVAIGRSGPIYYRRAASAAAARVHDVQAAHHARRRRGCDRSVLARDGDERGHVRRTLAATRIDEIRSS
jgi:hypothetical protein